MFAASKSAKVASAAVSASDAQIKYVTTLLSGDGTNGATNGGSAASTVAPFTSDASTNNTSIVINGDVKPNRFNPNQDGYYSNYFDGGGNYLAMPGSVAALNLTGDFTVECWAHATATTNAVDQVFNYGNFIFMLYHNGTTWTVEVGSGSSNYFTLTGTASLNAWHHFAITRNANTYTFWIDGVSASTTSNSNAPATSSATLYIGRGGASNSQNFTGYISNFRIVKGTSLYTSTFTPSTTSLTAISGTSLLICQSPQFIDKGPNAFTITTLGTTTVSYLQPFAQPTTVNVPSYYSTKFDGSSYLSVPANSSLQLTGDFTMEAWVYLTTINSYNMIIASDNGANSDYMGIRATELALQNVSYTTWSFNFSVNTWYHVAISRSSNTLKAFVNGNQLTLSVGSATNSAQYLQSGYSVLIGKYGNGYNVTGQISNARIVKGVAVYTGNFTPPTSPLAATQSSGTNISAITGTATSLLTCQNSILIDNSTNAFTISSSGAAVPVTGTPFTQSYTQQTVSNYGSAYLDGDGDYLTVPANAAFTLGTNNHTIECWYYSKGTQLQNTVLWAYASGSTNQATNSYYLNVGTGGPAIVLGNGGGWGVSITFTAPSINAWHHIAVVRSGNVFTLYIDGVSAGTGTYAANIASQGSFPFEIGGQVTGTGNLGTTAFNGYISNFRVTNGTALYTSNFAPPASPLTNITNTSLLTLQYNGATNDSGFIDQSPNNFLVTRNGNPTQGSFAPFGSNWSYYFNGSSSNFLQTSASTVFAPGTGDFTVEGWFNPTDLMNPTSGAIWAQSISGTNYFCIFVSNGIVQFYGTGSGGGSAISSGSNNWTVGSWNHFAVVRISGTVTVYLNGIAGTPVTNTTNFTNTSILPTIGGYSHIATNYYYGYISNLRYVKGVGVYTGNFTVPTSPLTATQSSSTNISAITNGATSLITCQSPSFIDNSVNAFTFTTTSSPSVQRFSPFSNVLQTPKSYATKFNGSTDYLTAPSNAVFAFGTDDFTVEAWVYPTTFGASGFILLDTRASATASPCTIAITVNGYPQMYDGATAPTASSGISLNTWSHIAYSRAGGILKMFVNGVSVYSAAYTTNLTGTNATIGSIVGGGGYLLNGSMSNLRIVKGIGVYTGNFTVPTSPLEATQSSGTNISAITGTQTSLLTVQSSTIIDNSTNAFTITAAGSPTPRTVNPFGYTTSQTQSYSPSVYGGSMYFGGAGDYLSIPASAGTDFGTGNFTIEMWIKPSSLTNYNMVYAGGGYLCLIWGATASVFSLNANNGVQDVSSSTSAIPISQWTHIAFVRSSGTLYFYINGVVSGSGAFASAFGTSTGTVSIAYNPAYAGLYYTNAGISNLRVVKGTAVYTANFTPPTAPVTAITGTQLLLNGTNAGIYDSAMQTIFETVGNAQISTTQKKYDTGSIYFDGTGDYLKTPASSAYDFGSSQFTIECWIYPTSASTQQIIAFHGWSGSGAYNYGWNMQINSSNQLAFYANGTLQAFTDLTISTNMWTHIAFVGTGGVLSAYKNGTKSATTLTYVAIVDRPTMNLVIGGWNDNTESKADRLFYAGYIDDFRITKGYARYTANFTPPTAALPTS